MKYCKKCLTTDLRPNALFEDGVCIACNYSTKASSDGLNNQLISLRKYIQKQRRYRKNKYSHDCIVGVSGGKDSTRQAHWVRDRLQLRPLLICAAYPPKQMSQIGADNVSNLISMGFDLISATPAPKTAAYLSRRAFEKFGNVCTSTEIALFSTVPRIAITTGINLIFWGENPALQVGDAAVLGVNEFDGNNLRNLNTLQNAPLDWIEEVADAPYKVDHYRYPSREKFDKNKTSIIYLGPAWDDWSNSQNATYAALQGLNLRPNEEHATGDLSNASMLDEEFTNINMMIKYFKFGFGRATDQVNEQIRNGILTRDQAINIVEKYDGVCSDTIIEHYCRYIQISPFRFWEIVNQFVNKDIFEIRRNQRPVKKFSVGSNFGY
jgi:N-acetyl sugar amidotransferase